MEDRMADTNSQNPLLEVLAGHQVVIGLLMELLIDEGAIKAADLHRRLEQAKANLTADNPRMAAIQVLDDQMTLLEFSHSELRQRRPQ